MDQGTGTSFPRRPISLTLWKPWQWDPSVAAVHYTPVQLPSTWGGGAFHLFILFFVNIEKVEKNKDFFCSFHLFGVMKWESPRCRVSIENSYRCVCGGG